METELTRRALLGSAVTATAVSMTGCLEALGFGNPTCEFIDDVDAASAELAWDDLDDLAGDIVVYSGRTDDQVHPLFTCLESNYDDLTIRTDYDDNQTQVNVLNQEGANSEADIFYSQSSSALAQVADATLARPLSEAITSRVPADRRDPDGRWVGTSGRVRAIQYNTDTVDPSILSDIIFDYAEDDRYVGRLATRPNSGSFRAFIAAMLELEGEARTREWIRGVVEDQGAELFSSGSQMAQAVADGDVDIALGNQYYAARLLENDPDTPIDVAFTRGDAGALFNVAGVAVLESADDPALAETFVEHLLAAEAQQFFVTVNGEYPVIDGVEYVGDLPRPEDIDSPSFDLSQLVDLGEIRSLLTEEGMTV